MPRRARPRRPPVAPRVEAPAPRILPDQVTARMRREALALAVPAEVLAARLQAIADCLHAARTAPREPAPRAVLEWIEATDARAAELAALMGEPQAVLRLVPDADPAALAAVARLREALAGARWKHLARAMTATAGRPRGGGAEARAKLAQIGAECFAPPLRGRRLAAFARWFFAECASRNGGQDAPSSSCNRMEIMTP